MSLVIKDNSENINGIKSQKDIILEKIHRIKSYNDNLIKEYFPIKKNNTKNKLISPLYSQSKELLYDSNKNTMFKKIFIKPLVKKNRIYKPKFFTNNCTMNKKLNFSNIKKLNKKNNNDTIKNLINNNIINYQNKTITNNENSLNETTSDYDIEKIAKYKNRKTINTNNIDNNMIDTYLTLKKEKKNNNMHLKNRIFHCKKTSSELNSNSLKNSNFFNLNILENMHNKKERKENDMKNITPLNLLSNDKIKKNNNTLYLNKLFSISTTETDAIINNKPEKIRTDHNINKQEIYKNLKNNLYLNDTISDINKTSEDIKPNSNYYTSITEAGPNSYEIETAELKQNKNMQKINVLETKRKIINSIEKEKQKIIDESIKNYKKYLFLIEKQQQEYEEYDKFLKKELNKNKSKKLKLKLFKEKLTIGTNNTSQLNEFKNKKMIYNRHVDTPQYQENKTLSSKNLDYHKKRNKNEKKFVFPNKNDNSFDEKKLLTTSEGYEPLLSEDNESNLISNFNTNTNTNTIEKEHKNINKRVLNINNDNIKKFRKIEINKDEKTNNNILNSKANNNKKSKSNVSSLNMNYFSLDTIKKMNNPKNNTEIMKNQQNFKNKNEFEGFNNKNKLTLNAIRKRIILNKKTKDKIEKEPKTQSNLIHQNNVKLSNNSLRFKSLKKLENYKSLIAQNILNKIPLSNIQEIHRMISEEKKKALNKLYINLLKYKEKKNKNEYNQQKLKKEIKEDNKNVLNADKAFKIKNGLYYSGFNQNKSEENSNFK